MHKKYIELFTQLAYNVELLAEQAIEYDEQANDLEGVKAAQQMRDIYVALHDKLHDNNFNGTLTKAEYAQLLLAVSLTLVELQNRAASLHKAIDAYQKQLLPSLQQINDNSATDEEAQKLGNEKFSTLQMFDF